MNAVEIEEAVSKLAEAPFDPAAFPFAFLEAFGNKETTLKRLRTRSTNKSDLPGGVLQRNNIHIQVCPEGEATATLTALRDSPATTSQKAKFILATDGKWFEAENLVEGGTVACAYADFHDHFGFFLPLAGITTVKQIAENAFDIKATGRLNRLYIELLRENAEWDTEARREDLNHFFARLIFCYFAEDTSIFNGEGLFTNTVDQMSERDASNTHEVIAEIFRAMNTKLDERDAARIRSWADQFPYVNGNLFSGSTDVPRFSRSARAYLIHVGRLDWKRINPDIFGSMIQAVADDEERGALGMHYTSVPNILKVLNPLFLDDLRAKLDEAGDNARKLLNLRNRIARIRVFDPACGSGNFLVIAYKEMRAIEWEINKRRGEAEQHTDIPRTNFRGIEIRGFAAEIARLALIIAEYQCDVLYRGQQLALAEFLPLEAKNWITCGNALRLDWLKICPPTGTGVKVHGDDLFETPRDQAEIEFENEGGETYICGNPPYAGSTWQSTDQKEDLKSVFAHLTNSWRSLDYVAGWFMMAANYGTHVQSVAAFVATNSICQGQQVPILWPLIYDIGHQIVFAYRSFQWSNLASYNAGVTVIIAAISNDRRPQKCLYWVDDAGDSALRNVPNINAYLVTSANIIVNPASKAPDERSLMVWGNKPTDGGHLLMSAEEKFSLLAIRPNARQYVKRFVGALEFIHGQERYCLWIDDGERVKAEAIPEIAMRLEGVAKARSESKAAETRPAAAFPHRFRQIQSIAKRFSLIVAGVSSERREYVPVGLESDHVIVGQKNFALYDAPLWNLALLASRIHRIWIWTVCSRLRTDPSYSNTLGWNTFPVPPLSDQNKADLTRCAEDILLAREAHFPATIADLYDPESMPADLRSAHERNDETLERIYIGRRFKNDTERLEKLFEMYTQMTAGREEKKKPAGRKRKGGAG